MNTVGWIACAVALVVLGVLVGLVAGWIDRPTWMSKRHTVVALIALTVLAAVVTVVLNSMSPAEEPASAGDDSSASETEARVQSVAELAPDLADRLILSYDDSSGSPVIFSSLPDGSNRQRLWNIGGDFRPAFMPDSTDLVVTGYVEELDGNRLEVRTITGDFVRALTSPGDRQNDLNLAVSPTEHVAYFVREYWTRPIDGTSSLDRTVLMRVPLDGSSAESEVPAPVDLLSISVSDDGSVIAGECGVEEGPTQGCIFSPGDATATRIPASEGATMGDVEVSPDGRWVAFTSVEANPHGISQVYVYDRETGEVVSLSQLPGTNDEPAWAPQSDTPCLAFSHYELDEGSVYVGCLLPEPTTVKAIPIGHRPVWFRED